MRNKIFLLIASLVGLINIGFSQLNISTADINPTCFGDNNGSIDLTIFGGTAPYTITWTKDGFPIASNDSLLTDLTDGTYIANVVDFVGTSANDTSILAGNNVYTVDTIVDAPCYGAKGSLKITPYGGTYQYVGYWKRMIWEPSINTMILDTEWADTSQTYIDTVFFQLAYPKGNYILTVVDSLGCVSTPKNIEIKEPTSALSLQETHSHNICKNDSIGQISIQSYGGTAPYTYAWSNGKTTASNITLKAGTYTVTVRDDNNCLISESIDIEEPFQDLILISDIHDVSCRDNQDGYVLIENIENGLVPFSYAWSNNETDEAITDLLADTYSVTITDANNCTIIDTFDVELNDVDCIVINNVITPDDNGKNDEWIIKNIHLYPDCDVKVIDRWGNVVFSKTDGYDNLWDATSNGNVLSSGDYYYIVNLNTGNYPPYTGPLKIIK